MKNKCWLISLIILLAIIMIFLTIFFIGLIQNGFKFKGFKIGLQNSDELILDKTYDASFKNIVIDATTSNIFIKESNENNIKAVIYGTKDDIDVKTNLDTLNVKINEKKCIGICFNQKSAKVEIYLPQDFDGNMDIKNDYGDIYIGKFLNANLDIAADCGDVEISGGNIIKVDNNYGDIRVEKANLATINEDCGDVFVSDISDATIKNSYGDIKVKSVRNYLNLANDCGDIEVNNVNLNQNSYIKDDYGDVKIGTTNEIFIDAKTDLGKINIKNNYNKSDITLKIENDCGDVLVNN